MKYFKLILSSMCVSAMALCAGCTAEPDPDDIQKPDDKIIEVTGITVEPESLDLLKGQEVKLEAVVLPENATDKTVAWKSSDPEVAAVSEDGTVSALAEGAATITAAAGDKTAFCTVSVSLVDVESVTVEPHAIEIMKGGTAELTATVLPEDAEVKTVIWSSSDEEIVTVDENGVVTAVAVGSASIMAEAGTQGDVCEVTVLPVPVETVTVSPDVLEMRIGDSASLSAEVLPEDAEDKTVTWSSSDETVAMVSETGEVTAIGAGDAVISAVSGGIAGSCDVHVMDDPKVGDFYYSDGTYSTDLNMDKTVIGVVFWVGDATADDATLKTDHPECTNGLVVALDEESNKIWQSGYSLMSMSVDDWVKRNTSYGSIKCDMGQYSTDRCYLKVGYNNTKAIEAFNAAAENASWPVVAIESLAEYREQVPAPETSSDWFFPSLNELHNLCAGNYEGNIWDIFGGETSNEVFLNERLAMIDGATALGYGGSGMYWSSSELNKERIAQVYFGAGTVINMYKKDSQQERFCVRYVLAF